MGEQQHFQLALRIVSSWSILLLKENTVTLICMYAHLVKQRSTNSMLAREPLWCYLFWAPFSNVVYLFSNPARKWSLSKSYWRYSVKKHLTRTPQGPVPACQKVGNMHTVTRMFFHVHLTEYKNTNLCKLLRVYRQWYAVKYDQYSKYTQQDFGFNFPCLVIMA